MSRLPIRARLTAVFILVMGAVLVLIGSFLYFRTKANLDGAIAQSLAARQSALAAYADSLRPGERASVPPGDRLAQLLDGRGAVLAGAGAPLLSPAQAAIATRGPRTFEVPERTRVRAGPARLRERPVVAVAAASLSDRESALESLAGALLIGGPLALGLASLVAYATAAGALRPVEEVRRRAAQISSADATALLPLPAVDDELRRLTATLNDMLARLAASAAHERRLIANASHELRTPLSAMRVELELLERHGGGEAELRTAVGLVRGDVARLTALTDGLLALAVADEGRPPRREPVEVDALLRLVASDARSEAERRGRTLDVEASGLTLHADASALRGALQNLVANALLHGRGAIRVGASATPTMIELWVLDAGSLHPDLVGGAAFERFARGPDTAGRPGAGLGLALARSAAEGHGGTASLEELVGGGVRATLRLPR